MTSREGKRAKGGNGDQRLASDKERNHVSGYVGNIRSQVSHIREGNYKHAKREN